MQITDNNKQFIIEDIDKRQIAFGMKQKSE